jgi:hypothetical protein
MTDAEHAAALDASELLDELRPRGYAFALAGNGTLRVAPPAGADKEEGGRIAALAPAGGYVLRLERWADPLPDACRTCGAPVWQYSPNRHPYCEPHYRLAEARELRESAAVALDDLGGPGARARGGGRRSRTGAPPRRPGAAKSGRSG